jgi:hypothetical protein
MNLTIELLENAIAIVPAALALLLVWKRPRQIASWVAWVLGTSAIAVMAMGLLLKRLTSACPDVIPTCEAPSVAVHRMPGIFRSCVQCGAEPLEGGLAISLNQFALPLQAGVAALCILISFVTTIRFILWARKSLSPTRSDSGQ